VALVQDAGTKEILQAAVVPVEVFDTKPTLPLPNLPGPSLPLTGPMLLPPVADEEPAVAEKPKK
jgi:hypothetical protein